MAHGTIKPYRRHLQLECFLAFVCLLAGVFALTQFLVGAAVAVMHDFNEQAIRSFPAERGVVAVFVYAVPYIAGIASAWWLWKWARMLVVCRRIVRRRDRSSCPRCGYSLAGVSVDRCTECGFCVGSRLAVVRAGVSGDPDRASGASS